MNRAIFNLVKFYIIVATLDFQATLKPTVDINLLGTRRVMELCQQLKNIKVNIYYLLKTITVLFIKKIIHI